MTDSERLAEIATYLQAMDNKLDRLERQTQVWADLTKDVSILLTTSSTTTAIDRLETEADIINAHVNLLEARTDAYWKRLHEDFNRLLELNTPKTEATDKLDGDSSE